MLKKRIMKVLSYVSIIIAFILISLGVIDLLFSPAFLPYAKVINYFHVANSFLLLTICFRLFSNSKEKPNA